MLLIRILDAGDIFDTVRVTVKVTAIVADALGASGAESPDAIFFGHRLDGEALLFEVLSNSGSVFPGLPGLKASVAGDKDEGVGRERARAVEGETGLPKIVLGKIVCRNLEYAAPVLIEEPGAIVVGERVLDGIEAAGAGADGEAPDWFRAGIEAAMLAPTAVNQQKFKFILHPGHAVEARALFSMVGYTVVDLGIAKYHFEVGAGRENFSWK